MGDQGWAGENEGRGVNDHDLLKDYAVGLVARHIQYKEKNHIEPLMAIMSEMSQDLMDEFRTVLNELVRDEVLTWSRNINGTAMFEFKRK